MAHSGPQFLLPVCLPTRALLRRSSAILTVTANSICRPLRNYCCLDESDTPQLVLYSCPEKETERLVRLKYFRGDVRTQPICGDLNKDGKLDLVWQGID